MQVTADESNPIRDSLDEGKVNATWFVEPHEEKSAADVDVEAGQAAPGSSVEMQSMGAPGPGGDSGEGKTRSPSPLSR